MGRGAHNNDERQSNASDSTATAVATGAEVEGSRAGSSAEVVPSDHSRGIKGGLASISTTINDHLGLFRAGTATLVVGSALAISVLVYRRGLHGFVSVNQVPASYFQRRKRLRVRIAEVTALGPTARNGAPEESYGRAVVNGEINHPDALQGSDVLLHAEHITLPRRLLRLPPRSLPPSTGGGDAATFTIRLCGVSAAARGLALAREELVDPSIGQYCDAELLFREQTPGALQTASSVGGFGLGVSELARDASTPVAVCHIHRRRGVLWRDVLQSTLDPEAGFGERLVSDGLAIMREERWWAADPSAESAEAAATTESTEHVKSTAGDEGESQQILLCPKRFREDLERFVTAQEDARREGRGLWRVAEDDATVGESAAGAEVRAAAGGAVKGLSDRAARVVRAVTRLFGR
ncbi:unnamed protein product [Scytosiphon promiscuus]